MQPHRCIIFILCLSMTCALPSQGTAEIEQYVLNQLSSFQGTRPTIMQSSLRNWHNCGICEVVVYLVRTLFARGHAEDFIVRALKVSCSFFKVESRAVCNGIIPRFKDMLFVVIQQSSLCGHDFCSLAFPGLCGAPTSAVNWTTPASGRPKPPIKPVPLPSKSAPRLRVLHLADTHVDSAYTPGSLVNCADPLCCRKNSTPHRGWFTVSKAAGFWGSYLSCDIPERTLIAALKYISETVKPDLVYYTGDIIPHDVWETTVEGNLEQFQRTLDLLTTYLPGVKVIPAIGNHESNPVNSFPISGIKGNFSVKWLYDALANVWSHYIPEDDLEQFRRGGYFSHQVSPRLRIISLNMNYCNTYNWWMLINSTDPTGQLEWLTKQLQECEDKGILVHILGHIPPGQIDCFPVWSRNFNDILNRYEATVTSQFYGHTHLDEFAVAFDKTNKTRAIGVNYVAPSITTYNAGGPTFRVYSIDGIYGNSTYQVLDYETYAMDLDLANQNPRESYTPTWEVIRSIKELFKMDSLQPAEWAKLVRRLRDDESAFKVFFSMYTKRLPHAKYTSQDRRRILCRLITTRSGTPCYL